MFKFIPNTAVPGFRVGRPDDDELGFNVADDDSTPPVLPGAPDVPTVDDNYPFGATSPGFVAPQAPSPNPVAPPGTGSPLPPAGHQMPTNPMAQTGSLPLDPRGYGGAFNLPPGAATVIGSWNNMDIANAGLPMRADTLGLVFLVPNARN